MLTGWAGYRSFICRAAVLTALLIAAMGAGPAFAQTTIRIDPNPVVFPVGGQQSFDIYVDNIPSSGIGSFWIFLSTGFNPCLAWQSAVLDPNLEAAWGGNARSDPTIIAGGTLSWIANYTASSITGPSGTVKLGTVTYAETGACTPGTQDLLDWVPGDSGPPPTGTIFAPGRNPLAPFSIYQDALYSIGPLQDIDLTVACTRVPPDPNTPFDPNVPVDPNAPYDPYDPNAPFNPHFFVDGDTIALDCSVSNAGTAPSGGSTLFAVFSTDSMVDSTDTEISSDLLIPNLGGGNTVNRTLKGAPIFTSPGPREICTKIDVDPTDFDAQAGRVAETDEGNNVDCLPITVLPALRDLIVDPDPNTVSVTPSPIDPNNFRAGLALEVSYRAVNQGIAAVRFSHRNVVRLDTSLAAALANSNSIICGADLSSSGPDLPLLGGTGITQTYGFGGGSSTELCLIPFGLTPGTYSVVIEVDTPDTPTGDNVVEKDPNGNPAELNNALEVVINILAPLPPEFRVHQFNPKLNEPLLVTDDVVNITGPGSDRASVSMISAVDVAAYDFTLTWSPANLISIGDPNNPAGDPNEITFTDFLEQNGRTQSCSVTGISNAAGTVSVSCTSSGTAPGANTQNASELANINFTAVDPNRGTLTLSGFTASDSSGQPITGLTHTDGEFFVTGSPNLSVSNAVPPVLAYPGQDFTVSYDIDNTGFGGAFPPIISEVIISRGAAYDPNDPEDLLACQVNESTEIIAKSTRTKTLTSCNIVENIRPGLYTGFYWLTPPDPNRIDTAAVPFSARVVTLRKDRKGRFAETSMEPDTLGGTTGMPLASTSKYPAKSIAGLKSASRNRNWVVRLRSSKRGKRKVELLHVPLSNQDKQVVLTKLRLPREDKTILGGVDIDVDGDEELIILQRSRKTGDSLDLRRVDYARRNPVVCQSAAITADFVDRVVAATGIDHDMDPNTRDQLAVVTEAGGVQALTIYDMTFTGSLPPASPCKPVPTLVETPASAALTAVSSDPNFGTSGDKVLSICALDFQVDGQEEIASLHDDGSGVQALKVFDLPAVLGGTAALLADDPAFGGTQGAAKALAIACTR
jgi:hypothetical protein